MNSEFSSVISLRGSPGFLPRAEKVVCVFETDRIRLLEMAIL